jgi:monooxygenase
MNMAEEHFDVIIVGAGLSGIGAAYHLQSKCPGKSYAILEGREAKGGTWDLFRYPGIRSDSDMHTLGYNFKPWQEAKAIADGPSILNYINETATENDIERHIRYQHLVSAADWSSTQGRWNLEMRCGADGEVRRMSCNFLLMCSGYYSYKEGYTPEFPGADTFKGTVVHPQKWPEDLDYAGKRVVIIGSGATAMTLVPEMAHTAASVTMLQRSPTYVFSRPDKDAIANFLRKILPSAWAYAITRWKNTTMQQWVYHKTRTDPDKIKDKLLGAVREELGPDYDVEKHFTPSYNPWDQRLCLVPNSDLFAAIRDGSATVVTEHIDTFTEQGIQLKTGEVLEADIIVTATGLNLVETGDLRFSLDQKEVDFAKTWTYKGLMTSGIPNMVITFGYINASWTLRADLTAEWVCRVLNHMDATGTAIATPKLSQGDQSMTPRPWIEDFSSGYMQRMMHRFPRQGDHEPWINPQDYGRDKKMFRTGSLEDGALQFSNPVPVEIQPEQEIEYQAAS